MSVTEPAKSRAGRNLKAAIIVAVVLLSLLALSLAFRPEPFVVLVAVAIGGGLWELRDAFATRAIHLPIWPLLVGAVAMPVAAYARGPGALFVAYVLTLVAVAVWPLIRPGLRRPWPLGQRDLTAGVFAATYVPLLASFLVLILVSEHGNWLVALTLLLGVASDTGGYVAGVFFGKHPMAPTVSPKKSWEGMAGSVLLAIAVGVVGSMLVLELPLVGGASPVFGSALGLGALLGVMAAATSTIGDLSESLLKRDLGIKDMSQLLPGHGGILDRIDSALVTAPFVYLVLTIAATHRLA